LKSGILLASTLALTLLALTHPAWAWSNVGHGYSSRSDYGTRYSGTFSVYALVVGTQASLPDALDAFYAHPVNPREVVVMWLGAGAPSGMLLKNHEKVVLIDPANKITGDAMQRLQQLDILLITHEHSDHFSSSAVIAIQSKTGAIVVVNPGSFDALSGSLPSDKLVRITSGDTQVLSGIGVTAIASIHPADQPLTYILTFSDFSAFHGSDSGFNPALSGYKGKAKLAMVPTGGASPSASPEQALQMVKALDPSDVIPMHGSTDSNDRLGALLAQQMPNVHYVVPQPISGVVVDEMSGIGFVTILASVTIFFLVARARRQE
jgi:L-ascorbate metabolism protein UlaG (beta-lactamase superfamily)